MKIQRFLLSQIKDALTPGKVIVLYGPRQVGKTTLAKDLISQVSLKIQFVNADELIYREALSSQSRHRLGEVLGDAELLVIGEAQRVPDIGLNLKILVDSFPQAIILATGSASFDLANKTSEPLTGRSVNSYFWRTYDQKEMECIEEHGGKLYGYELKWQSGEIRSATRKEFLNAYPNSELMTINQENFESFQNIR